MVERLAAGDRTAVDALPELAAAFDAYIAKFGDRCTQELKLESRTLHEDPAQVLMAIAAAAAPKAAGAGELPENAGAPRPDRAPSSASACWRLAAEVGQGARAGPGELALRTNAAVRPRAAHLPGDGRAAERKPACWIEPRDVFNLTVEELLGRSRRAPASPPISKRWSGLRDAEHRAQLARPDPPERFSVRGAHISGVAAVGCARRRRRSTPARTRKGLACCKGCRHGQGARDRGSARRGPAAGRNPAWRGTPIRAGSRCSPTRPGVIAERGSLSFGNCRPGTRLLHLFQQLTIHRRHRPRRRRRHVDVHRRRGRLLRRLLSGTGRAKR